MFVKVFINSSTVSLVWIIHLCVGEMASTSVSFVQHQEAQESSW